jgi:hypothetical protein
VWPPGSAIAHLFRNQNNSGRGDMHRRNSKTDFNNKSEHEKIVCHNGTNKYEWKSTRLQLKNNKPMLNISLPCDFSFEQNCKACFNGTHFQAIKDVHKKNGRVTKGKYFEGDNMYIQ